MKASAVGHFARMRGHLPVLVASLALLLAPRAARGAAAEALRPASSRDEEPPRPALVVSMSPRITRIEIDLTLDPSTGLIREIVTATVSGDGISSLAFRLQEGLVVEKSMAGAGVVDHRKAGNDLTVDLDPPIQGTRTIGFEISGRPRRSGKDLVERDRAVLGPDDDWYPRAPFTWAETEVAVRVPKGWTAVAPGSRGDSGKEEESGVWRWKTSKPVRGVAVAAAPGLTLSSGQAVGVDFRLAAPAAGPRLDAVLKGLSEPMAWFAGALAPYPFDGFNLVLLPGAAGRTRSAGMLVAPLAAPLGGPGDGADLLAGQWFGERLLGDGGWMDAFAAWEATVFTRDRAIPLPAEIARLREAYLASGARDVPLSRAGFDAAPEVLKGKGSAAPDMVRLAAGDREFFDAVRDLFVAPVGAPWTLRTLQAAIEKRSGRALVRPFADWFDRTGVPEFETTLRVVPSSTGGYRADLTIRQRRGLYALPVDVVFLAAGEEHRETVEVDGEDTSVFYVLPFEPVRVEFDPLSKIFKWPTVTNPGAP